MENTRAVAILKTLASGVNPVTGEVYPMDSPYQDANVVRALYTAIDACIARPRDRAGAGRNVGKPWADSDDQKLLVGFDQGASVSELAHELGRTIAGIEARLERHGRVSVNARGGRTSER